MQITSYCAVGSCIYGHILVLNLHSMCAALLGMIPLLFWFLTYCLNLPTCLCSSWLPPLVPFLVSCFFRKLVALFPHIWYFCLSFYHHQIHFHTNSIAPFHNIVPVQLQLFLCLYSLFVFLNRRLLLCDTVCGLSLPVRISFFNFAGAVISTGWLHACVFQAVDCDPFGLITGYMIFASAAIPQ